MNNTKPKEDDGFFNRTGIISENPSLRLYDFERVVGASEETLPESFMLPRTAKLKNQGGTSACCGCAMATIAEYIWGKEFSAGWNYGTFRTHSGAGLYMQKALELWQKIGTVPSADFGILCEVPEIQAITADYPELLEIATKYRISGYANLCYAQKEKRIKAVKQAVMRGIPVLAAITYRGAGHAVVIDGWNDNKKCFTVQNSFGSDWGQGGYGEIGTDEPGELYAVFAEEIKLPFEDVSENRWSYSAIKHMYMNGLMNGVSDTAFEPERAITREEFATALDRLCEKTDERLARIYELMSEISGKK